MHFPAVITITWHDQQLSRVSHHSSASAKQLASKLGLEELRAGGDNYVNSICTCRDELKEHLAPVREWKKEFDEQLKALGLLKKPDDVDRSLDPFLDLPQLKSATAKLASSQDVVDDQDESVETDIDALETRLERIMLDSYGYNPEMRSTEEEVCKETLQEQNSTDAIDSSFECVEDSSDVQVDPRRTGLSPDLGNMHFKLQETQPPKPNILPLLDTTQSVMDVDHARGTGLIDYPFIIKATPLPVQMNTKAEAKEALLIDFSDDEDDNDGELIVRCV